MINEPKKNKGLYEFTEEIKETSIRKHYTKAKPLTETMKRTDFLYCDPPEVILQSKFLSNLKINFVTYRCRKE
jgi:site-specific DNA-adenine methylase